MTKKKTPKSSPSSKPSASLKSSRPTSKASAKPSTKPSPKASSKKSTPSKKPAKQKLTGLQRLRRRKLKRLEADGSVLFSDRDLHLLLNERGFPSGVQVEGKIGVTSYTAEEGWEPGFYIWKIGQDWKFSLENHSDGGIIFTDISDKAPAKITSCLIEQEFTNWLTDFLKLDHLLVFLITPDGKLAATVPTQARTPSQLRHFSDQLTKNGNLLLKTHDLRDIITQTCLPTNGQVEPDQIQVVSVSSPHGSVFKISWEKHRVTLQKPKWGGVQAKHHRGNKVIEDQFSGAYFFNWLSEVLQVPQDLFAEITPDGYLKVEQR
jgi:hypothetical protein